MKNCWAKKIIIFSTFLAIPFALFAFNYNYLKMQYYDYIFQKKLKDNTASQVDMVNTIKARMNYVFGEIPQNTTTPVVRSNIKKFLQILHQDKPLDKALKIINQDIKTETQDITFKNITSDITIYYIPNIHPDANDHQSLREQIAKRQSQVKAQVLNSDCKLIFAENDFDINWDSCLTTMNKTADIFGLPHFVLDTKFKKYIINNEIRWWKDFFGDPNRTIIGYDICTLNTTVHILSYLIDNGQLPEKVRKYAHKLRMEIAFNLREEMISKRILQEAVERNQNQVILEIGERHNKTLPKLLSDYGYKVIMLM